jgi:protein dithiol:quinone oxidoreductase
MLSKTISSRALFALIAALCFGGVGLALVSQYMFDMQPCAWCTMQRLVYLVIGALALLALAVSGAARKMAAVLMLALAASGVGMAMYQQFVAAKSFSCGFAFPDRFMVKSGLDGLAPWLFRAMGNCADANLPLLGVPYAFWSAALFAAVGVVAVIALRRTL